MTRSKSRSARDTRRSRSHSHDRRYTHGRKDKSLDRLKPRSSLRRYSSRSRSGSRSRSRDRSRSPARGRHDATHGRGSRSQSRSQSLDRSRVSARQRSVSRSPSPRGTRHASDLSSATGDSDDERQKRIKRKTKKSKKRKKDKKNKKASRRSVSPSPSRQETTRAGPGGSVVLPPSTTEMTTKRDGTKSFFDRLREQESAKEIVGTVHAGGGRQTVASASSGQWECSKAGCGHKNSKYAGACSKCGAMKRMSEWR